MLVDRRWLAGFVVGFLLCMGAPAAGSAVPPDDAVVVTVAQAVHAETPAPAPPVPGAIATDHASLRAGVASYGKSGFVRLVLPPPDLSEKSGGDVVVRIQNEGQESFTVRADDTWTALTGGGRSVALVRRPAPGEKRVAATLVVEPQRSLDLLLGAPADDAGEIVSVTLETHETGTTITAKDVYAPPRTRQAVPPRAPPGPPAGTLGAEEVTVAIVVGADGSLESMTPLPDETGRMPRAELVEATRAALRKWTFEPARQNGAPARALFEETLTFSARTVVRRVFAVPPSDLMARLDRDLRQTYPWVVSIGNTAPSRSDSSPSLGASLEPSASRGFAVAGRPWKKKGIKGADAWLLRVGEAAGSRTWVAVTSLTLLVRESPRGSNCECYWWAAQENGAQDFMDLLAARLDLTAVEAEVYAPQDGALIPSGLIEADELGRWSRTAVRKLLGVSLASNLGKYKRKAALKGVLASLDPDAPPPAGAEFLPGPPSATRAPEPYRVGDGVSAPVLRRRVNPEYPAEAKNAKVQGRVWLETTIDATGTVTDLEILRGISGLNVASVDAVCCWRYKPAMRNGQPVSVYDRVFLDYGLR